jgi:hypothetical protein
MLGTAVRLSWTASVDDTGVTTYLVFRDGGQVGSSSSTSFDDTTALPGSHVYTVYARDAAGNVSPASAPYVVTVPAKSTSALKKSAAGDRTGPRLRLTRRRARGKRLLLTAKARDRAGVARLELRIDGRRARARRAGRLSYRWHPRPGRHRLVVVAFDKRGNRAVIERRLRVAA